MLDSQEIESLLSSGYELRGFELKGPGARSDKAFFVKVARAVLGMGNLRDGGHVIVGIDDKDPAKLLPGLDEQQLKSWKAYDDVSRGLAEYASPPLQFNIAAATLSSGAVVAVIEVAEFDAIPHLCTRGYPDVLRRGALYVRSRGVPETSEVPTLNEMRDVIELATEKALRSYVETGQRAGIAISSASDPASKAADAYAGEREKAWP